jgi:hypothetical protein
MTKRRNLFHVFSMLFVGIVLMISNGCTDTVNPANTSYSLKVKDVLGVVGTAKFTQTTSTVTTIDITLTGAPAGSHPAVLCMNTVVDGGATVVVLNPVDATGKSSTSVTSMSYKTLIAYNGFIKVTKSDTEPNIILAQGDIGGNVLTTTNKTYSMVVIGNYGVSGSALLEKRLNGNALLTISLNGTIPGNTYPATINLGTISSIGGGPVVRTLSDVDGTTGKSYTNIPTLDSGVAITYDNWLVYDGYINIYQVSVLGSVICNGDFGKN